MFSKTAKPEPEPDKQMEELLELQARLEKVERRFEDLRDTLKKMKDRAGLLEGFIDGARMVLLKRVEKELDQTEEDDITENKRLQAKLKREFAKKAKNKPKPKLTRTEALIEMAREQGK